MSGGVAYVLDERHDLYLRLNKENTKRLPVPHPLLRRTVRDFLPDIFQKSCDLSHFSYPLLTAQNASISACSRLMPFSSR